jgi:hypothetical protein
LFAATAPIKTNKIAGRTKFAEEEPVGSATITSGAITGSDTLPANAVDAVAAKAAARTIFFILFPHYVT